VTTITNVLWSKRLDLLREMAPQATTIGYIAGSSRNSFSNERDDVVAAAQTLGREVLLQEISAGTNLDNIFQSLVRERGASALIVGAFTRASRNLKAIVRLATYHKVPAMFPNSIYVRAGGLMSYGAVSNNLRLAAAQYVARILKGEKPADLPVQQATHFKLTINLKTAKTLGLEVPTTLLTIADEVIE
jgi:putative ABC transport system substrate-binding protein